jgi:hypothetical protein
LAFHAEFIGAEPVWLDCVRRGALVQTMPS